LKHGEFHPENTMWNEFERPNLGGAAKNSANLQSSFLCCVLFSRPEESKRKKQEMPK
jgi:hypothetical protein